MVAQAIRANALRGMRQLDPMRDIYGVARLLEEAFRSEHNFPLGDFPLLREVGIWLWTFSYAPAFPPNLSGWVWLEDDRIVGNVTITQDERRPDVYMISNVAVKPEFRQQGIARALMLAALDDLRGRAAKTVLLNVRPKNLGAQHLYATLGFRELEMRGDWTRAKNLDVPTIQTPSVRRLRSNDARAVTDLLRAVIPTSVEPYRVLPNDFALPFDEQVIEWFGDLFSGQSSQRWALDRNERLAAMMMLRGQRIASPHRLVIQVHPRFRGQLENELVAFALAQLAKFPARPVRAIAADSHPELIAALEQNGFQFANGLTLMAFDFKPVE